MPERPSRATGPDPADDALATMNDHLGRFFRHADALLEEWQGYSDKLRQSIDAQVGRLNDTVASAVTDAGRAAAHELDGQVEESMAGSLSSLRRELDGLARLANQTAARMQGQSSRGMALSSGDRGYLTSPILWALVAANIMLAVLIGMSVQSCQARGDGTTANATQSPGVQGSSPLGASDGNGRSTDGDRPALVEDNAPLDNADAGAAPALTPIGLEAEEAALLCTSLAKEYDSEAAEKLVGAAVESTCDAQAAAVNATLMKRLGDSAKPKSDKEDKANKANKANKDKRRRSGKDGKKAEPKSKSGGKSPAKGK